MRGGGVNRYYAKFVHDTEQDQAECRAWMESASLDDIAAVWEKCQFPFVNPIMELVTRFAQLKLAEMIEEKYGAK